MTRQAITKPRQDWPVAPILLDCERTRACFSREDARRELDGLPGGKGLNTAHVAYLAGRLGH
jgi:hypothetical protein